MTLPSSGPISLSQVAAELGLSLPLSLGDSPVLTLAGKSAPPISLSDLYGKSAQAPLAVSAPNADQQYTSTSSGTGSATTTATATGGSGGNTFAWNVVSNQGNASVGALNDRSVTITKSFVKNSTGSATVVFNVNVTDSQGHMATANNITLTVEWASNN